MINKKTLLSSALSLTLFSSIAMAADFYSDSGFQNSILTPSLDTLLPVDERAECMTIDNSTTDAWNTGEICFASEINTSSSNATSNFSVTKRMRNRARQIASRNILGNINRLAAECFSDGGSSAASDEIGGFCMAADLNTSITGFAEFSVANDLPVAGLQFLQAAFGDGTTLSASAPVSSECISAGGSISAPEDADGFCLASDLSRSATSFAKFSVANGIPLVGLQFLQVMFAVPGSSPSTALDTKCVSAGGSAAATGSSGGFCLAADLSTSTAGIANFSVAHDVPVTDLQYLQVTFENASPSAASPASPAAGAPVGAECISVDGSIAAIGNPKGFCLVSDLIESSIDSADITIANDLSVSGMQFLQVIFADGSSLSELPASPSGAKCVSDSGSTAAAANPEGFCLVADLISSTIESATISVANDLPVIAWEFIQVPSENIVPLVGSSNPQNAGVPVGLVVSGFEEMPFELAPEETTEETPDLISSSALVNTVSNTTPFFHLSNQTNGIEINSTPYWRTYPHIGLWLGR
jgi:hypothetical protein